MMSQWVNLLHGHYYLPFLVLVYLVFGSRLWIPLSIVIFGVKELVNFVNALVRGMMRKCRFLLMCYIYVGPHPDPSRPVTRLPLHDL
ncbi:hypothetical protein BDV34DRAFT_144452 [Aspergillus parasiticus]|uniref:Transmembrane protein n=1 Tax=Aspergillus parasiticus TaxID=5067 RepID=A0A5N6DFA7_ASPPA|nr:hypothetical protein BDV34DRAFT_144452 [Aspergillus parasiticus]